MRRLCSASAVSHVPRIDLRSPFSQEVSRYLLPTHPSCTGTTSRPPRIVLLGDITYESTNYRWRSTTGTHLTAPVTSTTTMHRTRFERRVRIEERCQKVRITEGDGENINSECDPRLSFLKFSTTHSSHKRHAIRRVFYHSLRSFRNFRTVRFFTSFIQVKIIPHAHKH